MDHTPNNQLYRSILKSFYINCLVQQRLHNINKNGITSKLESVDNDNAPKNKYLFLDSFATFSVDIFTLYLFLFSISLQLKRLFCAVIMCLFLQQLFSFFYQIPWSVFLVCVTFFMFKIHDGVYYTTLIITYSS